VVGACEQVAVAIVVADDDKKGMLPETEADGEPCLVDIRVEGEGDRKSDICL